VKIISSEKGRALKPGLKKPGPKTGLLSLSSVLRFSVLLHFPLSSSFCLLFSRLDCVSDNETRKKKKRSKVTHIGNSSLQSMLSHLKRRMEIWRAHRRLCPLWNRLTDVIGHIPLQNWAGGLYDSRLLIHQWGLDGGGGWMAEKSHFISLLHYFPRTGAVCISFTGPGHFQSIPALISSLDLEWHRDVFVGWNIQALACLPRGKTGKVVQ